MPYYSSVNVEGSVDSFYTYFNTVPTSRGSYLTKGSSEIGFRTKPPRGQVVKQVPTSTAEPYSWFLDSYQDVKKRAAIARGFDATLFRIDKGHTWDLRKYEFSGTPWNFSVATSGGNYTYVNARPSDANGWSDPSRIDLQAFGQTAYGRAAPRTAIFDLGVALGELNQGLPRFVTSTLKKDVSKFKALGDDYLNVQFGWIPFLNDIRDFASALAHASAGFVQPVGPYHRSYAPEETVTVTDSVGDARIVTDTGSANTPSSMLPGITAIGPSDGSIGGINLDGYRTRRETVKRRAWFEGEFVVLPKVGFDPSSFNDRLDALMKTDISPATLWELAPWSWLFDWFFHLGESIRTSELALNDRILSTYGYAMEEIHRTVKYDFSNIRPRFATQSYTGPKAISMSWEITSLRRVRANPFGFTLNPSTDLSGTQKAILGALGLTKAKF